MSKMIKKENLIWTLATGLIGIYIISGFFLETSGCATWTQGGSGCSSGVDPVAIFVIVFVGVFIFLYMAQGFSVSDLVER